MGNLRSCEKSRFLDEIDPRFVDFKFASGPGPAEGSPFQHVFERRSNLIPTPPRKVQATKYVPPADFKPPTLPTCKPASAWSTPSSASAW